MSNNIQYLKEFIKKDIKRKSIDFFSSLEIDKSYVLTEFSHNYNEIVDFEHLLNLLINSDKQNTLAIIGDGGKGKSQFLKMLYKNLYKNNKLPLYISLQDFSIWQKENFPNGILDYIQYLTGFNLQNSINSKNKLLIQGTNIPQSINKEIYLLLDGLDEYDGNIRGLINNELLRTQLNFNIIITSRTTHTMYLNDFDLYNIQPFDNKQIYTYLSCFFDKQDCDKLYNSIKSKCDIYTLVNIPLFLALLCRVYKNNPSNINLIHSKSDFIQQIFNALCDEKLIEQGKRKNLLDELCNIAYNLKLNNNIIPSQELLKLQLLIPVENSYQFIHKLFEDYYSALFVANNKTSKEFLDYKKNNYKIFSSNWKQTIIFWFGLENVSDKIKLKYFYEILNFNDKTSGWYKKRAFLLCCEIIGEYKNIPNDTKEKLLNKFINVIKNNYNLTDNKEVQNNKNKKDAIYLFDLANVTYNTDRVYLCDIVFKRLKIAWDKKDKKVPFTTYINILANLNYSSKEFRNLLIDIFKERNQQYSFDLYQKAFKSCAYGDIDLIEFLIERIANPTKYNFNKERHNWDFIGIIDILSDIIPTDSLYINKLFDLYHNKELLNQYGKNKLFFVGKLKEFLRHKSTNENILEEIGISVSRIEKISTSIKLYLETNKDEFLEDIIQNIDNSFSPFSAYLEQIFKNIELEKQKTFLKIILFDSRFNKYKKNIICTLANSKYKENDFLIEIFNNLKSSTDNELHNYLTCFAYVVGMMSSSDKIILEAISILKTNINNDPDNFECINWLGHISLEHKQFQNAIIEFLKTIKQTDDMAKIYTIFYIDIENENKTQYKNYLMKLILDKTKKDKRNDYLSDLYRNCINCPNNNDLVNFSIGLIKSLPLKNIIIRKFVIFLSSICNFAIWKIQEFKLKFKNKNIKKIICFIGNIFINIQNEINRSFFNHRLIYLDNLFIRNYITKANQEFVLKEIKKEKYEPILIYLAYEMDYIDNYKIYHPIKYIITEYKETCIKYIKKFLSQIINFCIKHNKIITIILIFLFITFYLIEHNKPLTIDNYIRTIMHKYTKEFE